MGKLIRKTAIGIGLAALGAAAVGGAAYAATDKLISLALDRTPPPEPKISLPGVNLAGYVESDEVKELVKRCSEELLTHENEEVAVLSHDGLRLVGHYFPCEKPRRLMIAFHGWRSVWHRDFAAVTSFWRENGCAILFVEQRAQGASEGEVMGFGLLERFDCLTWANYAMERFGEELPTYLVGVSMGASSVMMASGLELPPNIRGIMADCGYTSPGAIWRHVAERNMHIPYEGLASRYAETLCKKKIGVGPESYSCPEALANCRVPVLFIHGSGDHFVPIEMTYENYMACAAPKRLIIAPGADHGQTYLLEEELYHKTVKEFWREFDCPQGREGE